MVVVCSKILGVVKFVVKFLVKLKHCQIGRKKLCGSIY